MSLDVLHTVTPLKADQVRKWGRKGSQEDRDRTSVAVEAEEAEEAARDDPDVDDAPMTKMFAPLRQATWSPWKAAKQIRCKKAAGCWNCILTATDFLGARRITMTASARIRSFPAR